MYLARELTSLSWKEIGRHFGRHNHTGALFAHQKIAEAVKHDEMLADCMRRLRAELGA
jgi:chromosomal replication initiator protein